VAKGMPIYRMTTPDAPLVASSSVLLVRWNELLEWSESVQDPMCVEELHNMRIAAKRLRYTLEIFAPALGDAAVPVLKQVEEIQEQLGKIHDCDMLFPLVNETLHGEMERERKRMLKRSVGPPPFLAAEGLAALTASKRTEREERFQKFVAFWEGLPPDKLGAALAGLAEKYRAL